MKVITGLFVVLLAALPGWAQAPDPAKTEASPPNFFPLKAGTKWHYQVDLGTGQKGTMVNQIAKIETIGGKDVARLESVVNGNVVATDFLSANNEGVFRNRFNEFEVTPPVCLLKYPTKEGATWETQTKFSDQQLTVTGREGKSEEVQVPAGKFQAVPVVVEATTEGIKISTSFWFAENVGIVKQTIDWGGKTINVELVKFEPGK
jgi:hypothetical protein